MALPTAVAGVSNVVGSLGSSLLGNYLAQENWQKQQNFMQNSLIQDGLPASSLYFNRQNSSLPQIQAYRGNNFYTSPTIYSTRNNSSAIANKQGFVPDSYIKRTPAEFAKHLSTSAKVERPPQVKTYNMGSQTDPLVLLPHERWLQTNLPNMTHTVVPQSTLPMAQGADQLPIPRAFIRSKRPAFADASVG